MTEQLQDDLNALEIAEEEDDDRVVFKERYANDEIDHKMKRTIFINNMLCCLSNRCLCSLCLVLPTSIFLCLLALSIANMSNATSIPGATTPSPNWTFLVLALFFPAIYLFISIVVACLICARQIRLDTLNARNAHLYLQTKARNSKIAATSDSSTTKIQVVPGRFALFLNAAKEGDVPTMKWCIGNGQFIDEVDSLGRSALHWAAYAGQDESIILLLRHGASINLSDSVARLTPLHYAAYYGHVKVTRVLIEENANLLLQDSRGLNPLQLVEMASLKLSSNQPSHLIIIKYLRLAMKDNVTTPLEHITGLTVTNLVERQRNALPQYAIQ